MPRRNRRNSRPGFGPGIDCGLVADALDLLLQPGKVLLSHRPDLVHVEAEVFMDQDVPQRNDLWPPYLRIAVLDGLGNATSSLSHDLQVVDNPNLEHLIALEGLETVRDPLVILATAARISPSQSASLLIMGLRPGRPIPGWKVSPSRHWRYRPFGPTDFRVPTSEPLGRADWFHCARSRADRHRCRDGLRRVQQHLGCAVLCGDAEDRFTFFADRRADGYASHVQLAVWHRKTERFLRE